MDRVPRQVEWKEVMVLTVQLKRARCCHSELERQVGRDACKGTRLWDREDMQW